MRRYHLLLAGASWMAEYGDPDEPDDWAYPAQYSPYQNVRAGRGLPAGAASRPRPATTASTPATPARWWPGMREQGHDVEYYENIEGGHGGAADNAQRAFQWALVLRVLLAAGGLRAADHQRSRVYQWAA